MLRTTLLVGLIGVGLPMAPCVGDDAPVPAVVRQFVDRIEVDDAGVRIVLRDRRRPSVLAPRFLDRTLVIRRTDPLTAFRSEMAPEAPQDQTSAFIYFHSDGEEDTHWLYLKGLGADEAVFEAHGSLARGDGWADPYREEFRIRRDHPPALP